MSADFLRRVSDHAVELQWSKVQVEAVRIERDAAIKALKVARDALEAIAGEEYLSADGGSAAIKADAALARIAELVKPVTPKERWRETVRELLRKHGWCTCDGCVDFVADLPRKPRAK